MRGAALHSAMHTASHFLKHHTPEVIKEANHALEHSRHGHGDDKRDVSRGSGVGVALLGGSKLAASDVGGLRNEAQSGHGKALISAANGGKETMFGQQLSALVKTVTSAEPGVTEQAYSQQEAASLRNPDTIKELLSDRGAVVIHGLPGDPELDDSQQTTILLDLHSKDGSEQLIAVNLSKVQQAVAEMQERVIDHPENLSIQKFDLEAFTKSISDGPGLKIHVPTADTAAAVFAK